MNNKKGKDIFKWINGFILSDFSRSIDPPIDLQYDLYHVQNVPTLSRLTWIYFSVIRQQNCFDVKPRCYSFISVYKVTQCCQLQYEERSRQSDCVEDNLFTLLSFRFGKQEKRTLLPFSEEEHSSALNGFFSVQMRRQLRDTVLAIKNPGSCKMGALRFSDSFCDGIFTWNQSLRSCLTWRRPTSNCVAAHFDARVLETSER